LSKYYQFAAAIAVSLFSTGCQQVPKPLLVGSQNNTAQMVVGEIVAQHLEHRLARKVLRRLGGGSEVLEYQSLLDGEISLYPTYTGAVETVILREQPASDPGVVWERSHGEMSRIAQLELLKPLGYDDPPAMVVRRADPEFAKLGLPRDATLSEVAAGKTHWKIGISYELQQNMDGIPAISSYKIPMAQGIRGMEAKQLFPALKKGDLSMIAADTTDGRLTLPDYQVLADDKHAFPPYQACLLVRQDALAAEPKLRAALTELTGKFTTEGVRRMSAEVDLTHREPAQVAAEFLSEAGLE
jgi:glycine betaine/choline ABC-type transport system substrate-binding protein